jgi:4-hydroxybenzoate polyprenyltransferase
MAQRSKALKALISFIKFLTYSNVFVSLCVLTFTHLTYIIYDLPLDNLTVVLIMVFSFTFFTYNGQRLFRLRKKLLQPENISERLQWVIKNKAPLTYFSMFFGIVGMSCTYFINPYCFIILIPMGGLSIFYVIPIIPFYSKSPTLRDLPYLKIFIIGFVWSIAIVWLPIMDTHFEFISTSKFVIALIQNFLFVLAITLPFDIRDVKFDKSNNLKTIPQLVGLKQATILSVLILLLSVLLLIQLPISYNHFFGLIIGHILTILVIAFTNEKRKELFFAGLIEGSVIILYLCVLIAEYLSSL